MVGRKTNKQSNKTINVDFDVVRCHEIIVKMRLANKNQTKHTDITSMQ